MVDFVSVDGFRTLLVRVSASNQVGLVQLNRPRQGNAMTLAMAEELVRAFKMLDTNADVAVVMLAGSGKHFCTGLDLGTMQSITAELFGAQSQCPAQTRLHFLEVAKQLQVGLPDMHFACAPFMEMQRPAGTRVSFALWQRARPSMDETAGMAPCMHGE